MRQRGVALITAIVVVAIATVLAVRIGTRAAMDLRRTAGLVALDQGWHVALGAEAWAIEVLSDDHEDSPEIDHLGEAWAQPLPPLPVDGGEVRGALEDMQGRFNLNNLVNAEREPDVANVERFQRLLVLVGAQPRWARHDGGLDRREFDAGIRMAPRTARTCRRTRRTARRTGSSRRRPR